MATIQDRPFSRDYSGLKNQVKVGGALVLFCLTAYELMRRKRRGRGLTTQSQDGVGSVETWEFGYLYQGRCWAKKPSPSLPKWPLTWILQDISISERTLPDLIGIDATLYIRFLRGCFLFTALQTCTTFPVLFSIHFIFSSDQISPKSMNKVSVSSLVGSESGLRLLYVHVILAYWLSVTWFLTLLWIARGTFRYRALAIQSVAETFASSDSHSGPQKPVDKDRGLRLRTVMVTNIPHQLRSEKALKEYFEYYMSRPMGAAPLTPGLLPKLMAFIFNRAAESSVVQLFKTTADDVVPPASDVLLPAIVERVTVARKTTELASLLKRRDDILKKLEYAHVRLARQALLAVRAHLDHPSVGSERQGLLARISSRRSWAEARNRDEEDAAASPSDPAARMDTMAEKLAPFVSLFHVPSPTSFRNRFMRIFRYICCFSDVSPSVSPNMDGAPSGTIWEALHTLPRTYLDAYQPLIRLHSLFLGATVPAIDYYTAKLGLLTALINENRGRLLEAYPASSTAFVTFETVADARLAAKYMQVHPRNPLACVVVPAPDVADLDWTRVMKSSFKGEFLKDWVVNLGVWAFTCSWVIPISLFVGLVTIQTISIFIPGLQSYLKKHPEDQEAISLLIPTILVSILTILIPMLLLLIAKKAHTIITFSKLHDTIMIRYWKFLVCNLLIFFCVGVAALESFLQSFRSSANPLPLVAASFPTAGPFYVGWLILQTAVHGGLELGLFGLPLIVYPATRAAKTLRRRAAGIRPRTFNFYYWLPNHVLVMTIMMCFALLNPLVIPFALLYFSVESVIVKHQLIHVYAKIYDNNGKLILVRIVRYSLDGLILAHVVFLAFLVVLKEEVRAGMMGLLLGLTVIAKIIFTQLCRVKFTESDRAEDSIYSTSTEHPRPESESGASDHASQLATLGSLFPNGSSRFWTWRMPGNVPFSYSSVPARLQHQTRRAPNPFGPNTSLRHRISLETSRPSTNLATRDVSEFPASIRDIPTSGSNEGQHKRAGPSGETLESLPNRNNTVTRGETKYPIVTPHAKHENWDDFPHLDRPYQNPYYVQPVDNFMWLPRNPFGVLDLDDSVNLHQALTTEPGGGQLGQWLNEGVEHDSVMNPASLVETPGSIHTPESRTEHAQNAFPFRWRERRFSGNEEISMSSVLSFRVDRIDQEHEVDDASPPRSHLSRYSGDGGPSTRSGRQGAFSNTFFSSEKGRSLSGPSSTSLRGRRPSVSTRTFQRTYDPVFEPDVQAEAPFLRSTQSMPLSTRFERSSLRQGKESSRGPPIPMRDAVAEEIMAEAEAEAKDRVRLEEEEKRMREGQQSSWFTSWLWNRRHQSDQLPSITDAAGT